MKKILTILASFGLTTATTTSLISCQGGKPSQPINKTSLKDLDLVATIPGIESMTDTNAFDAFIQANANVLDLRDNVSFGNFRKPEYKSNGSLTITAKPKTKYTGSITVTITAIGQQALSGLGLNLDLDSTYDNEQTAFDAFLQANSAVTDLKDNVTHSDFVPSSYGTSGSLKISATPNGKYSGFVTLNTKGLAQTSLKDLHLVATISGVERMTDTDAFNAFIQANANVLDLRDNVSFGNFRKPEYKSNGSLTITAKPKTKYTGSITVTITAIGQQALSGLGLNLDLDSTYDNEQTAFDAFLQANSAVTDLKDNVTHSDFVPSSYGTSGSLKISATPNGKYSGFVTLNTKGLAQTSLKDLHLVATISGVERMTDTDAFNAFIQANANVLDLRDNVSFGNFRKPEYKSNGSLTITAKPKTKYTGSITVTITAIGQQALSGLGLNLDLDSTYDNEQTAFDAFLQANSAVTDLKDNVTHSDFVPSSYGTSGSLKISATPNGKYSGFVTLNTKGLAQTSLKDLHLVATISGVERMTDTDAFNAFIQANANVLDLRDNVSFGNFRKPEYKSNGSLTITAKPKTKYTESVTVTITAIGQQALADLSGIVSEVPSNTTKDKALQNFLDLNKTEYPDLEGNVTLDDASFIEPNYTNSGSYIIDATPNGKYTGSITVTITAIGQQALSGLGLNLDLDATYDNEQTAFDAFLQANSAVTDLKDNVTHSDFVPSSYGTSGSLKISATPNGKYSGFVTLNTKGLAQTDFSGWNKQNIYFSSIQDATQEETYNWFMNNNPEQDFTDFKNYVTFDFRKPTSDSAGWLTITAKPKTKYRGEITITITIDNRPVLNGLDLITEVENTTTEDIALSRFLSANNSRYPDLQGNVHLEPDSFLPSTPQTIGSFIVTANSDSKYQGSVKVIISAQEKIALDTVITNKHISGVDANTPGDVIQKILDANPNSGVTQSDLKLSQVNYKAEGFLGTATVEAQSSSKFSGTVLIDFAIMPDDDQLTTIISNIKNNQSNQDFIRSWGEYFGYYNNERLQYIIDSLKRSYKVNVGASPDQQKQDLQNQIFSEFNYWFSKIVEKDGLSDPSLVFRNYEINKTDIIAFDITKKVIQFNLELHFSWNQNEGGTIGYNVGRMVTFHFDTYTN